MESLNMDRFAGWMAAIAVAAASPAISRAQTWAPTAAGTYDWNTNANWSPATFPNSTSATADVNNDILGNQTINLNQLISLNRLNLGDSALSGGVYHDFAIVPGAGGSISFANPGSGTPQVTSQNGFNTISAPIVVGATTEIRPNSTGSLSLVGGISGAGGLTFVTNGFTQIGNPNTYSGATTISAGSVYVGGSLSSSASGVNVAAGATLGGGGSIARPISVSGTLSPGFSPNLLGTLVTDNDVTFNSGSDFSVKIGDLAGLSSRIDISGTATNKLAFNGATLTIDRNSVTGFVEGTTYQYAVAALSTSGNPPNRLTVNGATVGGGDIVATATWDGTSWVTTGGLTLNPLGFDILGIGTTLNAQRVSSSFVINVTPAPEPIGLLAVCAIGGAGWHWRRKRIRNRAG